MTNKLRGLVYDLETSYILAYTFSLYPESISHNNIVEDWHIHCASWKWLGEDRIYTAVEKDGCDKNICEKLAKAMQEADFLVAHNGIQFDIKKLKTRNQFHKLPPLPPVTTVDTLREARACGAFTSNRLDYLGEYLGVGRKLHNSPQLWARAFNGEKKALKEMLEYNKQDILLLEEVYNELKPYMKSHPNYNVIMGTEDNCPRCGHAHYQKRGFVYTQTTKKQRNQCLSCFSWFTTRI